MGLGNRDFVGITWLDEGKVVGVMAFQGILLGGVVSGGDGG